MELKDENGFDNLAYKSFPKTDICPIMSIGRKTPAPCVASCAWFDTGAEECAISRINADLKWLHEITK